MLFGLLLHLCAPTTLLALPGVLERDRADGRFAFVTPGFGPQKHGELAIILWFLQHSRALARAVKSVLEEVGAIGNTTTSPSAPPHAVLRDPDLLVGTRWARLALRAVARFDWSRRSE